MGWVTTKDDSIGWVRYCFPKSIFPQITVDLYLKQVVEDAHTDALEFNEVHDMMSRLDTRMSSLQVTLKRGVISDIRSDG